MVLFCLFAGKFVDPIAVPIFIHKGEPGRPGSYRSARTAQYPMRHSIRPVPHAVQGFSVPRSMLGAERMAHRAATQMAMRCTLGRAQREQALSVT
jgi:hypothetical protein